MLEIDDKFKTRRWVFTIHQNEIEGRDIDFISKRIKKKSEKGVQWVIVGKEKTKKGGRHLQCLYI